jgi:hypothetical protein
LQVIDKAAFCNSSLRDSHQKNHYTVKGEREIFVEDEIYATHTHIVRVRVMKTVAGSYRGIVHLREVGAEPESDDPHETDRDFAREDQARDAARPR